MTALAHPALDALDVPILVFDAAGLALFSVAGTSNAMTLGVGPVDAVLLGAITAIGGGMLRDILVREIPVVLRTGLYAIPALIGAAIVVVAAESGSRSMAYPILGAAVCFLIRLAAIRFDLNVPGPKDVHDDRNAGERDG